MPPRAPQLTRHDCYEHCVQNAPRMAAFLQAVLDRAAPKAPRSPTLREDFAGTAGVARAWLDLDPSHRAIAVDADAEPLARTKHIPRLRAVRADVRRCNAKAHVISATNFPIGYWHSRADLIRYLRATRQRLHPRGVFVCDTYTGPTALTAGLTLTRRVPIVRHGQRLTIRQTWEQRAADERTRLVTDVLHFEVRQGRRVLRRLSDAFIYEWRLWSIPELTDAIREVGFKRIDLYDQLVDAIDHTGRAHVTPLDPREPLQGDHVIWLAATR